MSDALSQPGDEHHFTRMSDEDLFVLVPYDGTDLIAHEAQTSSRHTAERLRVNEPQRYEAICRMLEEGQTLGSITRTQKVGINTLYRIIEKRPGGMASYRARCADKLQDLAHLCADVLMEEIPKTKDVMKVAVTMGIAAEKAALLKGLPTIISENRVVVDSSALDAFTAKLLAAKAKLEEGRAPVLDGHIDNAGEAAAA